MPYQRDYTAVKNPNADGSDVPPAKYVVEIEKFKEYKSKNSGDPVIKMKVRILLGEHADEYLIDWITLFNPADDNAHFTKHFLNTIGQPLSGEIDPLKWIGKRYVVDWAYNKKTDKLTVKSRLPFEEAGDDLP